MKTLRFIGVALLTVLMSVSFSACGGSDDDDNGGGSSSASIEGTWKCVSAVWYKWDAENNRPGAVKESYTYENKDNYMILTKSSDGYICTLQEGSWTNTFKLVYISGNEYYTVIDGERHGKFVVKTVTDKQLVVEEYETYYINKDHPGYGVLTYSKM